MKVRKKFSLITIISQSLLKNIKKIENKEKGLEIPLNKIVKNGL